jgi:hypothetical protein
VHVVERVTVSVAAEKIGSIFMDSCATHHIISDRRLMTNIRESDKTYIITGFNGAEEKTALVADCMLFGEVIVVPESKKNIISLERLGPENKVRCDHSKGFTVSAPDGRMVRFDKTDDALFEHEVIDQGNVNAVDTATQRELTVGAEQLKRVKEARRAEEVLGFPSPGGIAYAINKGAVQDASFTAQDVAVAEQVLDPHPARIKGKARRARQVKKKNSLPSDGVKCTLADQDQHCDHFQLGGRWLLLSTVVPLGQLLVSETTRKRGAGRYKKIINNHILICENHGFDVKREIVDLESSLVALVGKGLDALVVPVPQAPGHENP